MQALIFLPYFHESQLLLFQFGPPQVSVLIQFYGQPNIWGEIGLQFGGSLPLSPWFLVSDDSPPTSLIFSCSAYLWTCLLKLPAHKDSAFATHRMHIWGLHSVS